MIPIGATVQWAERLKHKAPPIGVVTARNGRMVEIDGRGWWVSEGLLEVVEGMAYDQISASALQELTAMTVERDTLQGLVAHQCEVIAILQAQALSGDEVEALREKAELWDELPPLIEALLSEVMGTPNPVSLESCPLPSVKELAQFVKGY